MLRDPGVRALGLFTLIFCPSIWCPSIWAQNYVVSTVAGNGTIGYSGDTGPAVAAQLFAPECVAADTRGNLYIADVYNNVIREVTTDGNINTIAGNGTRGYSGDGGAATSAQLSYPCGLAMDRYGNLFIADSSNDVIREVTTDGNIQTVAGVNTPGYSGDGGPATAAQLYNPYSVAVDAAGNLYISDTNNHVVREVSVSTGNISTIAGTGHPAFAGDGGPASSAQLFYPKAIAVDTAGNLFIADFGNSAIRKISKAGTITTIDNNVSYPEGVAVDSLGNAYVADTLNQVIRIISPSGSARVIAGNGSIGYQGDGGAATAASFDFPKGIALTASGTIFIGDWDNSVIRLLSPAAAPSN